MLLLDQLKLLNNRLFGFIKIKSQNLKAKKNYFLAQPNSQNQNCKIIRSLNHFLKEKQEL